MNGLDHYSPTNLGGSKNKKPDLIQGEIQQPLSSVINKKKPNLDLSKLSIIKDDTSESNTSRSGYNDKKNGVAKVEEAKTFRRLSSKI